MTDMLDCAVFMIVQDEQDNLERALNSVVGRFLEIHICDGFSKDRTMQIIESFEGLAVYQHKFQSFAIQREYLVNKAASRCSYFLFLDADEVITDDLFNDIRSFIDGAGLVASFKVKNFFMGHHLKYSFPHPPVPRLFLRKSFLGMTGEGAREYFTHKGVARILPSPLHHEDLRPIENFINKQLRNARMEACFLVESPKAKDGNLSFKEYFRITVWPRLPLPLRPLLYFIYRYFFKLGMLDGTAGFIFCAIQSFYYQTLIITLLFETKRRKLPRS